jgi:HK97 gp10 family phage protein
MGVDNSQVDHLAADLAAAPAKVAARSTKDMVGTAHATQRRAQQIAPVLTGLLHDSITVAASGLSADVTATARYAVYVEYGTSDTRPQPFMRPAAELAGPRMEGDLGDAGEDIL